MYCQVREWDAFCTWTYVGQRPRCASSPAACGCLCVCVCILVPLTHSLPVSGLEQRQNVFLYMRTHVCVDVRWYCSDMHWHWPDCWTARFPRALPHRSVLHITYSMSTTLSTKKCIQTNKFEFFGKYAYLLCHHVSKYEAIASSQLA